MADIQVTLENEFKNADFSLDIPRIRTILDANNSARVRTWLSICSRCGLCAESCFV